MEFVILNGVKYNWYEIRKKMDDGLVDHIVKQYGGNIEREKLLEEYVALAGWWFVLKDTEKIVEESENE